MAGLYIHIPFCRRKCVYCAFYSTAAFDDAKVEAYRHALAEEARWFSEHYLDGRKAALETLYIGGGTPSLLPVDFYVRLIADLETFFNFSDCREVSFEANPEHLDYGYLRDLRQYTPVRRLSIGVQSFRDDDLKRLNRCHTGKEAVQAVENAWRIGFENLSADLIYGLWEEGGSVRWKENLACLEALGLPHFSAYALSLEPRTRLWKQVEQGKARMASDEELELEYRELQCFAKEHGYLLYEISNLAKPGFEAIHNSNYWRNIPYVGLGASAHSYWGKERFWNTACLDDYLKDATGTKGREVLSEEDVYHEYVMTALRTIGGVKKSKLSGFSESLQQEFRLRVVHEMEAGNLVEKEDAYVVAEDRRLLTDLIAGTFF